MELTRQVYDEKLKALHAQLLKMSSLVEQLIDDAVTSLAKLDTRLAEEVIVRDDEIDALEVAIEEACTRLIALQQPLARDLRAVATGYRLVNDLERMGDYSVNIAKVTKKIAPEGLIKPLVDIPRMARLVQRMVHDALDAFVRGDLKLSEQVCARDREVDELNDELFAELVEIAGSDGAKARQAIHLILVARHLERIGDHAVSVAERAVYLETGRHFDAGRAARSGP